MTSSRATTAWLATVLAAVAVGVSHGQSPDQQIETQVTQALREEAVLRSVTVSVQEQVVTLGGPVPSLWAKETAIEGRPITFIEAALFQWINPKAWIMATGATVTYGLGAPDPILEAFLIAAVFLIAGTPFSSAWMLGGAWLKRFLSSPMRRRAFNWAMAALLVASLLPVMADLIADV